MQNPNDGSMELINSLNDPKREGKEHWQTYKVGDTVRFSSWWWEITDITTEGLTVKAVHKASKNDIELLEAELRRLKKQAKSNE